MQNTISDFSSGQQDYVAHLLEQHYGKAVELQLADGELQLDLTNEELTICPILYWNVHGAQFVISKVGDNRFRCRFFYSQAEQFGTEIEEFDDIETCVATVLQLQLAHASKPVTASTISTFDAEKHNETPAI
ncbi:MAG: hypothetical protein ACOH1I_00660 [Gallionellaceae bacterium]|jgi:hypothetical protein